MKKYIGLITALLPFMASAQLVMTGSYYVVMTGGTIANPTSLVLTNGTSGGIVSPGSAWIVSENEFNQVDWPIGTNTGTYVVPFGYGSADYLPLTCNITTAGVGSGIIKFATYHGANYNNTAYEPSDVTNMTDFGAPDYSINAVDRFYILDATGYTTKPTPNITFSYIRSGASEIAVPNFIVENTLVAQRFNTTLSQWNDWMGTTGTDATTANTGTVSSGLVPNTGFFRSWCLFNDSAEITSVPVINISSSVTVYPNPGNGNFTVTGLSQGQVVELYDYLGQLLNSSLVNNSTTMRFDISNRANGLYLLRIKNADGSGVIEKKIVKTL